MDIQAAFLQERVNLRNMMVCGEIKIYHSNVKTLRFLKKLSNEANYLDVWLNFRRVTFSPVCLFVYRQRWSNSE